VGIDPILKLLGRVESCGKGYKALCPSHADFAPSLLITPGDNGGVVMQCKAGCKTEDVLDKLGLTFADLAPTDKAKSPVTRPKKKAPPADDIALRHRVYTDLIDSLDLRPEDREDLARRGLSKERIEEGRYRSLHFIAYTKAMKKLAKVHGDTLARVPGFVWDEGKASLTQREGLLVPVRGLDGRITACQVRTGAAGRKYVWLSSQDAPSGSPCHRPAWVGDKQGQVWVTEGPLKADVAAHLSGDSFLGIAGVTAWREALEPLGVLSPAEVVLAFDSDRHVKANVQAELEAFEKELKHLGYRTLRADWDGPKGIDDALLSKTPVTAKAPAPASSRAVLVRACDVEPLPIDWLWPEWLPRGQITLFDGDPGLGKSFLLCHIAACLSRGWPLPGMKEGGPPVTVVYATAEDDIARTLRPRMEAAGADLNRIIFWKGCGRDSKGNVYALPSLPGDLDVLEEVIGSTGAGLVVFDPLMSFIDGKVDALKDQHVRQLMSALFLVAERTQTGIIGVRHLTKMVQGKPIYRGSGGIGFVGGGRGGWMIEDDPNREKDVRHLCHIKTNLGEKQAPLKLRMVRDDRGPMWTRMVFDGESDIPPELVGQISRPKSARDADCLSRVVWLVTELATRGPVEEKVMRGEAYARGMNRDKWNRCKIDACVREIKHEDDGKTYLHLPAGFTAPQAQTEESDE
jgi:hypothetical protein